MKNSVDVIPNFFMVGMPKCGTTALAEFLRTHPDIFISEPKETNFFSDDMSNMKFVSTVREYKNLFKKANDYKVVGDASILHMLSSIAIENIHDFNPEAKLLVMLRNPMEMVPSFHLQVLFTGEEDVENFSKALDLEESRRLGKNLPKANRSPKLLMYSELAKYSEQIENIYKYFPKNRVKIILFDDFKKSNREVYLNVLNFLNLPNDGRVDFPRINDAKQPKIKIINRLISRPPKAILFFVKILRKVLNKPRLGIKSKIRSLNKKNIVKEPLSVDARNRLLKIYREDILKTEKLIGRDLSNWLS